MFQRQDLWHYPRFKVIMTTFRAFYDLTTFTLKDLDKFLWLEGEECYARA